LNRNRVIGVLATILMATAITVAVPAVANAASAVVIADMNGDGLPDKVVISPYGPPGGTQCQVQVEPGVAGGGFDFWHSSFYTYTSSELSQRCPDEAVAIKLGSDTTPDLITAFSFGSNDIVVLRNFTPAATYHGVIEPYWLTTADINGDGRQDLIEYTGQQNYLLSFVNNADGTLSGGSISEGCTINPQYVLADMNGDGGQDMVLSDNCQTRQNAPIRAEVLFGNGQPAVVLASTTDYLANWTVSVVDHNGDGIPDVQVVEVPHSGPTVTQFFQNDGAGNFTLVP
jgi:hypothetical protein